ncbi:hypothetical protein [Serratia marcescens]|uniref:hypothetical protein n=1 Tax=Serratia marcescens TaxID=615 RepID=UPI0036F88AE9
MDNKLSELSKPVGYFTKQRDGNYWPLSKSTAKMNMEPLYSQEYVSALLAELEKKDREIAVIAMVTNDQLNDVADHWRDTLTESQTELEEKDRRIAELEAKLATPVRLLGEMLVHDWEHRVERQAAFEHRKIAWDARLAEDKKAILAAGFTFTVEGDE